jgi:hypothetical protein
MKYVKSSAEGSASDEAHVARGLPSETNNTVCN